MAPVKRHEFGHDDYGTPGDDKFHPGDHIDQVASAEAPIRYLDAPPLVAAMTHEQRKHAERRLIRKIDLRLLPMLVLMYIMVCLHATAEPVVSTADSRGRTIWTGITSPQLGSPARSAWR